MAKTYLATLDENGKIPSSQLPSYVDDVLEYSSKDSFPTTGEASKIYVDTTANLTYRWSGSKYVEISPSLALGETSSTAYRGDRGKVAYDHSQSAHAPSNAQQNVQSDWNATSGDAFIKNKPTIPTKVGELTNDKDYATKTDVSKAIDNLEIGGRNLISNIDSNWQQGHWDDVDGNYMNYNGRICTKVGLKVSPGETYALKIYLNGVTDKHLLFRTYGSDGSFIGSVIGITNSIYTVPNNVYELRFVLYEDVTLDDLTNGAVRVKVEKGNKATDWSPAPEDTESEIQSVDNKLTTNLLKPKLGDSTVSGVSVSKTGDGIYTLNGISTKASWIPICDVSDIEDGTYMLCGCPAGGSGYRLAVNTWMDYGYISDQGEGVVMPINRGNHIAIHFDTDTVFDNVVFKPMITTNLNATYDDFVPYTGSTGQINSDVAEVRKDFDEHTHEIADVNGLQSALDGKPDYEEGKWTPIFDGKTYDYYSGGEYKRIGNIVFFVAYYLNNAFTSGVDITKVSGLPFSIKSSSVGVAAYTGYDSYINGNAVCDSTMENIRKYDSNTIEFGKPNASVTIKVTINAHISIRGYYYIA